MNRKSLVISLAALLIVIGGTGYYLWKGSGGSSTPEITNQESTTEEGRGTSFLDDFFDKLKPFDKPEQSNLKEYKDAKGIFTINYPGSWIERPDQGRRLTGVNITPKELLDHYSPEEQGFVKGLVVSADESEESPEGYFKKLVGEAVTGQIEAKDLTINGYPSYMVKGDLGGIHYTIYIVSYNKHIVYFNYRTKEEESAHQNDIKKSIDFGSYTADFETVINSIKFLK